MIVQYVFYGKNCETHLNFLDNVEAFAFLRIPFSNFTEE